MEAGVRNRIAILAAGMGLVSLLAVGSQIELKLPEKDLELAQRIDFATSAR